MTVMMVLSRLGLVVAGYGEEQPAQGLIKTRLAQEIRLGSVKVNSESLKITCV
jgi:hypothetical protein